MTPFNTYKRYNLILLAVIAIFIAALLLSYLFLHACREHYSARQAARAVVQYNGYYGSALHDASYPFKMELYRQIHPELIVLGSSRVLQFRGEYATVPFVNMGRAMSTLDEGIGAINEMLAISRPKVVLLGLDFWWFNPDFSDRGLARVMDGGIPLGSALEVLRWLREGKVTIGDVVSILFAGAPESRIGVAASMEGTGYDRYGSHHYRGIVEGKAPASDPRFENTTRAIRKGQGLFKPGKHIDQAKWQQYLALRQRLREEGLILVAFLPPVARDVGTLMVDSGRYGFVSELRQKLHESGGLYFDFHDDPELQADDCEFVDGFHGGEITYLRMLRRMAATGDSPLHGRLDLVKIEQAIRSSAGRVTAVGSPHYDREVDFLGLACDKSPAPKTQAPPVLSD